MPAQFGGSFAPPLDDNRLAAYRELVEKASGPVSEAMNALLVMVDAYREGPVAPKGAKKAAGTPHPSGMGTMFSLAPEEVERLDPIVPWDHELEMYGKLFDAISADSDKATRDAAFHLLWFGRELFLDRRPITSDQL